MVLAFFDLHGFSYTNFNFRFTRFSQEPINRVNRGTILYIEIKIHIWKILRSIEENSK